MGKVDPFRNDRLQVAIPTPCIPAILRGRRLAPDPSRMRRTRRCGTRIAPGSARSGRFRLLDAHGQFPTPTNPDWEAFDPRPGGIRLPEVRLAGPGTGHRFRLEMGVPSDPGFRNRALLRVRLGVRRKARSLLDRCGRCPLAELGSCPKGRRPRTPCRFQPIDLDLPR